MEMMVREEVAEEGEEVVTLMEVAKVEVAEVVMKVVEGAAVEAKKAREVVVEVNLQAVEEDQMVEDENLGLRSHGQL